MNIRPARVGDVPAICDLIRTFADRKLMIRRSVGELYESIREFLVATDDDGKILGCAALHAARVLEIQSVFTLTYVADFFEKCGYHRIEKSDLPHKIWNECVRCPLFPSCNEVALIRTVAEAPSRSAEAGLAVLAV